MTKTCDFSIVIDFHSARLMSLLSGRYETICGMNRQAVRPSLLPLYQRSYAEKTIRLTQIQDIAGCRIVTPDMLDQVLVVGELEYQFKGAIIIDRRDTPSHGYRAVHVIVRHSGKLVEIQVRTALQHLWAELSEKLADLIDPAIKYGGGGEKRPDILDKTSEMVAEAENLEWELTQIPKEDRPQTVDSRVEEFKARLFDLLKARIEALTGK